MSKLEPKSKVADGQEAGMDSSRQGDRETKTKARRNFLKYAGAGAVAAAAGVPALMSLRSCIPNVLYELPVKFKIGKLEQFAEGSTFLREYRLYIFREGSTLHCISARCSHLGCTVQIAKPKTVGDDFEFHCPCHGSKFKSDGTNFAGPAPRPLDYYQIEVAPDDGQLIVNTAAVVDKTWRLSV